VSCCEIVVFEGEHFLLKLYMKFGKTAKDSCKIQTTIFEYETLFSSKTFEWFSQKMADFLWKIVHAPVVHQLLTLRNQSVTLACDMIHGCKGMTIHEDPSPITHDR
jgi:hypothetical protein